MLTPHQKAELNAAMLEPDDLMDVPVLTELDQLAALSNAVLMLESTAKEIEASPAGHSAETIAYGIRCRCEGWRENINQRLRLLNR